MKSTEKIRGSHLTSDNNHFIIINKHKGSDSLGNDNEEEKACKS
jgi:hypothetical protein